MVSGPTLNINEGRGGEGGVAWRQLHSSCLQRPMLSHTQRKLACKEIWLRSTLTLPAGRGPLLSLQVKSVSSPGLPMGRDSSQLKNRLGPHLAHWNTEVRTATHSAKYQDLPSEDVPLNRLNVGYDLVGPPWVTMTFGNNWKLSRIITHTHKINNTLMAMPGTPFGIQK